MCIKESIAVRTGCSTNLHEKLSMHMHNQSGGVFELLNESYYMDYKNIFNTAYMAVVVKYYADKLACDFSISRDLHKNECDAPTASATATVEKATIVTSVAAACSCCICQLRIKNGEPFKFCISNHPLGGSCQRGKPKQNNCQLKYYSETVCDECMSSMTLLSKKSKTKKHRCIFDSCAVKLNLSALRTHLFKHLKIKQFVCTICQKDYCSKSGLKKHERKH